MRRREGCAATARRVRSAITEIGVPNRAEPGSGWDDGQPPLAASGLRLEGRLKAVVASLDRVAEKGG